MVNYTSLNQNRDFKRVYAKGESQVHSLLVTYAQKNKNGLTRVGITATKKVGKACVRNRARRVIKAALIQLGDDLPKGYDYVFVARAKTAQVKTPQVYRVLSKHLSSLNTQR